MCRKGREPRAAVRGRSGTRHDECWIGIGLGPGAGLAPLRTKWGWIVALGVVYVIAGVIALGSVVMATIASVWLVGI